VIILLLAAVAAFNPHATTFRGGPDEFGYFFESTQDPSDTISFEWIDPSGHAVITGWQPNDDDGWAAVQLAYPFPFYGDTLESLNVCTNGFLEYPVTFTSYANRSLPVASFPSLIAAFWDDLSPTASSSVRAGADAATQSTVISWLGFVRFETQETLSFQARLGSDGTIRLNVLRAPADGSSCTIGIQGQSGSGGYWLQYVANGNPAGHVPVDSTSVRFRFCRFNHDVGVSRIETPGPWIPRGSQSAVAAVVRNFGTSAESFSARAIISHNQYPWDTVFNNTVPVSTLAPDDSVSCYFGDWLVPPVEDSWQVFVRTDLPGDEFGYNDTLRAVTSTVPMGFGAALDSTDLAALGDGLNLAGITFRPDSNRFYLASTSPNCISSFSALDRWPSPRTEPFALANLYGDDMTWGISWDETRSCFWIGHVSTYGTGCCLTRHEADGTWAGDTWELSGIEPGAWFAGLDMSPGGTCYAVEVGGHNRIYELNPESRTVVRFLDGPLASYRALAFLGDQTCYVVSGGWNQHEIVRLSSTGAVLESAPLPDLADVGVFRPDAPCPDSLVWAWTTASDPQNRLRRVSLGRTWSGVGLGDEAIVAAAAPAFSVGPCPATDAIWVNAGSLDRPARFVLHDVSGRVALSATVMPGKPTRIPTLDTDQAPLESGVYFATLSLPGRDVTRKVVIMGSRRY
jgi:hypothetical protein